jgi:hypothetical protein
MTRLKLAGRDVGARKRVLVGPGHPISRPVRGVARVSQQLGEIVERVLTAEFRVWMSEVNMSPTAAPCCVR